MRGLVEELPRSRLPVGCGWRQGVRLVARSSLRHSPFVTRHRRADARPEREGQTTADLPRIKIGLRGRCGSGGATPRSRPPACHAKACRLMRDRAEPHSISACANRHRRALAMTGGVGHMSQRAIRAGDGREAEGGGLLNRYRVKSSIEGSNPSVSASAQTSFRCRREDAISAVLSADRARWMWRRADRDRSSRQGSAATCAARRPAQSAIANRQKHRRERELT